VQLANAFAALGARVSTSVGREHGEVQTELLKKHLDAGLDLLQTVVRKPTFAQADFDRVKAERTASLVEREQDPHAVASVVEAALLFGADRPYGHDDDGSTATLEKITRARVQKYWSDNAGPKNAALVQSFRAQRYEPEAYTLYTYASIQAWAQAATKARSTDMVKVSAALRANKFDTVMGEIGFDAKGDVTAPGYVMYVWKNGKYIYAQ